MDTFNTVVYENYAHASHLAKLEPAPNYYSIQFKIELSIHDPSQIAMKQDEFYRALKGTLYPSHTPIDLTLMNTSTKEQVKGTIRCKSITLYATGWLVKGHLHVENKPSPIVDENISQRITNDPPITVGFANDLFIHDGYCIRLSEVAAVIPVRGGYGVDGRCIRIILRNNQSFTVDGEAAEAFGRLLDMAAFKL